MTKNVTIYTTNHCTYCTAAKEWFTQNKVHFKEINVEEDRKAQEELFNKTGMLAVPIIEIGGKMIVGWDKTRVKEMLET